MKKVLSILLSLIFVISIITIPVFADDLQVEVNGTKTGNDVSFVVFAENMGLSNETLNVYIAYYDDEGITVKTESDTLAVGAKASVNKVYKATVDKYAAKIFVWEDGLRPAAPSLTSDQCGEKIEITPDDVWANSEPESENIAGNVADGSFDTKWVGKDISEDNPSYVTVYLGEDYILSRVGIAFGLGNERDYMFTVSASEDGENFAEIVSKRYNERNNDIQYFDVSPVKAKFVRYNILARSDGAAYCQVTEVEVYGKRDREDGVVLMSGAESENWHINAMDELTYTDYVPSLGDELYAENSKNGLHLYDNVGRTVLLGERLEISSVAASQEPEGATKGNYAANTLDENAATIWTAGSVTDETPATLTAVLDGEYYISKIGVAFDLGAERKYTLGIAISKDGVNYTQVMGKTTVASTNDMQYFDLGTEKASFVRFIFYQRADSTAGWIRISEIEVYGLETYEGAGAVMAQKKLTLPENRGDFELSFDLEFAEDSNTYYSGVSITSNVITGGADLDDYAALQLRFANDGSKVRINRIISNYFNEGDPIALFDSAFNRGEKIHFSIVGSRNDRRYFITVSDSEKSETQLVYFNYSDAELTRSSHWTWLDSDHLVFNTGAGASCEMTVSDITVREVEISVEQESGNEPANGIVRLEATRLESYPTTSGDYYGRYVYHNGKDATLSVAADKNPALTRFAERRGLLGFGVSLESVTEPGYFLVMEGEDVYLRKLENTGSFYARATFYKDSAENVGYYTGDTYSYRTYIPRDKLERYLYDTANDHKSGKLGAWKNWSDAQATFYVKSEVTPHVSDNFYGNTIGSQWWTNYPWKKNNPTNDSYNHSGLITKNNVIVENGELFLKATKASGWPTDVNGETGISYNKWGKEWERWKGYVGVVSIQNKVFNKQCYIEGSFKQPESPIGYWNAFWLTGRDSWPPEIDIFETLSSSYGPRAWHTAIHGEGDKNNLFGKSSKDNINITTGYHTFAMDWGYDYIKFYVDGKIFQRTHNNATLNFQKNLRLILNTGIGGWEAEPDDTMVWDDGLRCRYVRSFQY